MLVRSNAARLTLAAYLATIVVPDGGAVRVRASEQEVVAPANVAGILGLGPASRPGRKPSRAGGPLTAGQPNVMSSQSPLSAALMTAVGGRGTQFSEASLLADWDGREDLTADRAFKVEDLSGVAPLDPDTMITRVAISEHTVANGFAENVYYYGDSAGNVVIGADTAPSVGSTTPAIDVRTTINLPTVLNAFGTLLSDDQVAITGICINPVADLQSWVNVNGSFAPFAGKIGEALIVTYNDFGGGLRLTSNNTIVKSGVLAFPISDDVSPAAAPPGVLSAAGFPVTVGGGFGVAFSTFANVAGCAVDDDGNTYFQQVDLLQFSGANIVKITDIGENQDRSHATNGFLTISTLNPTNGLYGNASGPVAQVNRFTNYSGTSTTFGNITALAAGPGNTLYAALAKSAVAGDATAGLFDNPAALGATPSMIVSFSDAVGTFSPSATVVVADGFADPVAGTTVTPGVDNFRAFALGTGPDRRGSAAVFGSTTDTRKLEFQVDYSIYSGLAVSDAQAVSVISGGTPAGVGRDPSPGFGEVLVFPDRSPSDRRADYVDLRGNNPPNPPASGGNIGDGDSDRFDHIFMIAPVDAVTLTPTGLSGLARGFLRYTNRLAPTALSAGVTLGLSDRMLADNATSGAINFEGLDPGHQVAGGDDQNTPFRGDDSDGAGSPALVGPLNGGFEFTFGGNVAAVCTAPWNAFYLNSNGSISFNAGDATASGSANALLTGVPRIAPAWHDFDPSSRDVGGNLNTFPVQAIGFAGVNEFTVRWINASRAGGAAAASHNTFSVSLFDDGTGVDENSNQPLNPANPIGNNAVPFDLQEGPTDLRYVAGPAGVTFTPLRPNGTGPFTFGYGRMDASAALSGGGATVVTGYSSGGLAAGSVAEQDLSEVGRTSVIGAGTAAETAIFEVFADGDFDLRHEGNDAVLATPAGQPDANREQLDFFGRGCAAASLTLNVAVVGSGTVTSTGIACPGDCSEVLPSGTTAVLVAAPAAGFNFSSWAGCDAPAGASCSAFMNGTKVVTAIFSTAPPLPQPLTGTLNQSAYSSGQPLIFNVTMDPVLAGSNPVDAYIVVDIPGGATFSMQLPILSTTFVPGQVKIAGPFIPFAFSGPVLAVVMPADLPVGSYQFRTFLTQAGTLNVIGAVDVTPFTYTP